MTRGAGAGTRGAWTPPRAYLSSEMQPSRGCEHQVAAARVPLVALRRKVGDRRDTEGPQGKTLLQCATAG